VLKIAMAELIGGTKAAGMRIKGPRRRVCGGVALPRKFLGILHGAAICCVFVGFCNHCCIVYSVAVPLCTYIV